MMLTTFAQASATSLPGESVYVELFVLIDVRLFVLPCSPQSCPMHSSRVRAVKVIQVIQGIVNATEHSSLGTEQLNRDCVSSSVSVHPKRRLVCWCRAHWQDPFKGYAVETYEMNEDGTQITQTSVFVRDSNGQKEMFKTVWNKKT
jgi:hypothetical protein